jgi:hypothetical protein
LDEAGWLDSEELCDLLFEVGLAQRSAFYLVIQLAARGIGRHEVAEAVVREAKAFTGAPKAAKKSVVTTPPKSRSRPSWWVMAPCNH